MYDAANRLASVTHQAAPQTYTFDDNGNLLNTKVITSAGEIYIHLPGVIVTEKAGQVRYLLWDGPSTGSGQA